MNWVRLAAVAAAAGVLSTFTDWAIAGDWIQKRFGNGEIWRERGLISVLLSTILPFITCAAFVLLAWKLEVLGLRNCLKFALAIWVIAPLPLIISQGIFLKLNRIVLALLAVSWLVKLLIVAVLAGKYVH
jgi:hypothetical protein